MKHSKDNMHGPGQQKRDLPGLHLKALKRILHNCLRFHNDNTSSSSHSCPVCDETFFPSLLKEMTVVIDWFNDRAKELVNIHLATGIRKYLLIFKGKKRENMSLLQECQDVLTFASTHATTTRRILKEYDKIHNSNRGQAFKSKAQQMHIEILQSPWLFELMACYLNLRDESVRTRMGGTLVLFKGCSLVNSDGKLALTCEISDSLKARVDLNCPIYMLVYDAFALTCGHIFCYICACSAASVTIVDGLKAATIEKICPMCRQGAVYEGVVHLVEINNLLHRRWPEYYVERLKSERLERLQ